MKRVFTLFLSLIITGSSSAQVCEVTSSFFDICSSCSTGSNPAIVDGVFRGQLIVTGGISYTLPESCTSAFTFADNVTIRIDNKVTFEIPGGIQIAPNTTVAVDGHVNGQSVLSGLTYSPKGGSGGNYADLSARLSNPDDFTKSASGQRASLPVELAYWEAEPADDHIALRWGSASESDNAYYEVEHSVDGVTFRPVGRRSGQGDSRTLLDYSYTHTEPTAGRNYYRLRQVDHDGSTELSGIIVQEYSSSRNSTTAVAATRPYPNPARAGHLLTVGQSDQQQQVTIYTAAGIHVGTYRLQQQRLRLPADLRTGSYVLRVGTTAHHLLVR
ncbi:hypothetical protein LEM8419_00634 [Neolewinella maritima]|uniref:T9SS type A sorting domain-containing protein n=1 Tax=Neolewinella maritima TaxID=1383882 RepID=A0ABM9AYF7_9BACT|nr:T9SS type A sorting domain-containing protein [Neolewinella maritima]CAH0999336.1 hypothetical protein LEM8419_00634 [Neolewinella maritima]